MCDIVENEPVEDKKVGKERKKDKVKGTGITKPKGECMKCSGNAVILVRNGDPLCKDCFLEYIVHKFRATIGKARVIRQAERVLLACSTGASSSAMLDLVVRGLSKKAVKKLRFQPGVVYIDEGELFGRGAEERKVAWQTVKNSAENAGFPFHLVNLGDIPLQDITKNMNDLEISDGIPQESALVGLFNNVDTLTAKEDLLAHFKRWQLLKVAKEHGYDRVMVGDCSTTLSVKVLSDVAQGRGSQLPYNIAFKDTRSEISILRPMREFTKKEIEFYNCFNEVTSFSRPSFATKASLHASINRLTQEFIFGLQAVFPSTVNTVLRTGDKLTSSGNDTAGGDCCSICCVPLEDNGKLGSSNDDLSGTRGALDGGIGDQIGQKTDGCSGHLIPGCGDSLPYGGSAGTSNLAGFTGDPGSDFTNNSDNHGTCNTNNISDTSCCGDGDRGLCCTRKAQSNVLGHVDHDLINHLASNVVTTLCYGCRLTYRDLNRSQNMLPKFVTDNASKTLRRTAMKEEIKEFLLED